MSKLKRVKKSPFLPEKAKKVYERDLNKYIQDLEEETEKETNNLMNKLIDLNHEEVFIMFDYNLGLQ